MDEEIYNTTANSDSSYHCRRQHYRLNARHRLSNLTAEERSRWLARRAESQRQRRRVRQQQPCGSAESGRHIRLQRQTFELARQHVGHRDVIVTRARSTNAGPSHRVVAWEQPINEIGPAIGRGARLSSIKRLARNHCSTTTDTFGQQSVSGVGQSIPSVMRLSSIRRLARNHRSPNEEIVGIPNNEDQLTYRDTSANIPILDGYVEQVGEFDFVEEIQFANEHEVVDAPSQRRQRTTLRYHNCARNFRDHIGFHTFSLPPPNVCCHCQAKLFFRESRDFCCLNGKTVMPHIPSPPQELLSLFNDNTGKGKHFRYYIRAYNHIFAFTSMGVHIDECLANGRDGVYSFRAQGAIYHKIGSLLPTPGIRPRFIQLYIYDTDHEVDLRMAENSSLHRDIVEELKNILDTTNPFVHQLRQLGQRQDIETCRFHIKEQPKNQPQYTLPSASQVAAIIVEGGRNELINGRDIVVQTTGGNLLRIAETAGYYDPLQYPLLLPYGSYGWDRNSRDNNGRKISCRDFYSYQLQIRDSDDSLFLRGGRLFQQYVVDNFVKIDADRLRWLKNNQPAIRAEMYQGLQDALAAGENDSGTIGRRTILPSSYIGGPRDMYQRYQDAMALVQKYGKPDLFITMTCNPGWPEITNALKPGQTPSDRPDLTTRVFRAKYEQFKEDIFNRGVLGKVVAHVHVVEFQKRGLPHVHMLIILDEQDKLHTPEDYDRIVRAEIPDKNEEPELYNAVIKWMIHKPCGRQNPNAPCMKGGTCKKKYPKQFAPTTLQGNDSYPIYRRRDTGRSVCLDRDGDQMVDNRWVVPYNPWLLRKYDCHINVEVCSSITSVKYLYKYVYKGPDQVSFEVIPGRNHDEIQKFVDARWVCAPEALWRIYRFALNRIYPSVKRLQIHLPNKQQVTYYAHQSVTDVLNDERNSKTMLTEFFSTNLSDVSARQYLYREFPEHYRWIDSDKIWRRRESRQKVIARIYTVSPLEGDRFFLRLILNHVRGPTSFDDLLKVGNVRYPTFKQVAEKLGLLEDDQSIRTCLVEASSVKMPSSLRRLFVTILVYCHPIGVRSLWDEFFKFMVEDYASSSTTNNVMLTNRLLSDLNSQLMQHNKSVHDYDLPRMSAGYEEGLSASRLVQDELSIPIPEEDMLAIQNLNTDQRSAYETIIAAVERKESRLFFVDGPGGTGKTFLYRSILAKLRSEGHVAIATATSGIAATILPGGRTAHSRFKIPLFLIPTSTCTHRHAFEALDRTLQDIMDNDQPFGGKIVILGGDFRQVLPVIPNGTRAQTVDACVVRSTLWEKFEVLCLKENMRARDDPSYSEFLLRVGDGAEPSLDGELIKVPDEMVIPWQGADSIDTLIEAVFPNLLDKGMDKDYMVVRGLITPLNEHVDKLNAKIINMFPGDEITYHSFDSVQDDTRNLYQQELLNSMSPGGLPPHILVLKLGSPIMLLRNIDPKNGLCNGTRLICKGFYRHLIDAEIVTGHHAGNRVFIPRIPLKPPENIKLPFTLIRKQFPIRLSFALTINKAQGQTIPHVGIYLPEDVFSHGQLYVALSRGVSKATTKVLVKRTTEEERGNSTYTKNVVYKEVLFSGKSG